MAGIEFGNHYNENRKRLEKWLKPHEEKRRDVITTIAHRVAMRSAIEIVHVPIQKSDAEWAEPLTLQSMRCLLLSALAGKWPSDDTRVSSASRSATRSANSAADSVRSSVYFAGYAHVSAYAAASSATNSASGSTGYAASAKSAASFAIWESVRRDIVFIENDGNAKGLLAQRLWITDGYDDAPKDYGWSADDRAVVEAFKGIEEYKFWGQWLLDSYEGRKRSDRDWEMLKEIGLIDDKIWEQGAKAVAEEIERIEGAYLEKMLPIAEVISLNPTTHKAITVPIEMSPNQRYQNVLIKITRQISKFENDGLHNQFSAMAPVIKDLREVMDQFADNPGIVHDELSAAKTSIAYLIQQNELPEDVRLERLQTDIAVGCIDIQEAVPEVAATVEARIPKQWAEADDETRAQINRLNEIMPEATEGVLSDYQARDFQKGMDGDPRGLRRWFARSIRIYSVAKDYLAHPLFWQKVYELISQLF